MPIQDADADQRSPSYIPRVVDAQLKDALQSAGAVVIEGPKACGKTQTARQAARSEVLLDIDQLSRIAAETDPALVLDGAYPRLIDEWQLVPQIWNHVRRSVDDRRTHGLYILTGSAQPTDDITRHTGAGRFSSVRMRPLSTYEMGTSTGSVSLSAMLSGGQIRSKKAAFTVSDVASAICAGGWPASRDLDSRAQLKQVRDYVTRICKVDVQQVAGSRRDPNRVARLTRSIARNIGTSASISTLAADVGGTSEKPLDWETVKELLDALERLMIVEDQPAWAPHLRSKARLRTEPKRHFVDPSIAVAALRATPQSLLGDLNLLGLLFESMVLRDVRVYTEAAGGDVFYYRDGTGLEVDLIVEGGDGSWGAMEVKLSHNKIEEAAQTLKRFANKIDTGTVGAPTFLAVVIPEGYAYVRADGVSVIPICTLGP